MGRKLFVSDLDGTLLNREGVLENESRRVIREIASNSPHHFTIATARHPQSALQIIGSGILKIPFVGGNGTYLTNPDGTHVALQSLKPELAAQLLEIYTAQQLPFFISAHLDGRDTMCYSGAQNEHSAWYLADRKKAGDNRPTEISDYAEALEAAVLGFHMIAPQKQLAPLLAALKEVFEVATSAISIDHFSEMYFGGAAWVSCRNKDSSKASGLQQLVKLLPEQPEEIIVFGDELNDLPMFDLADKAIAVANAHNRVKAAADEVIGSNVEEAVAAYLRREVLT